MTRDFIPVSRPLTDETDAESVATLIREGWLSGDAPVVEAFEKSVAEQTNRTYAIAVNSGTSALDIAVESLNLTSGDEVIIPSFTIVSCLNAVLRSGATPVFVDVDEATWNVTAQSVESMISGRTRLIIVPHIYGLPAEIEDIERIAAERGIYVIEDAAEGLGLDIGGRPAGNFGNLSTLSFYANKVITTGEGGMVLTDDPALAKSLRELRNLGFNSERRFVHELLGWNYRMPAVAAGLGLSQVQRLDQNVSLQRSRGIHYQELLSSFHNIQLPPDSHRGSQNIYWVFGFVLSPETRMTAREFMAELDRRGIGSRPFFFPLHKQPVLENYGGERQPTLPISEKLGDQGLYIPSLGTSAPDREYVATCVAEILETED